MIKFEGKIGGSTKKHVAKKVIFIFVLIEVVVLVLLFLPSLMMIGLGEYAIFVFLFAGLAILFGVITFFFTLDDYCPISVEINDGYISANYKENDYTERKIEQVEIVVDYGEYYYFRFCSPHGWGTCFCQKDLIVEGTIEQFEEMFKDKIIRKIKNK